MIFAVENYYDSSSILGQAITSNLTFASRVIKLRLLWLDINNATSKIVHGVKANFSDVIFSQCHKKKICFLSFPLLPMQS